MWADYDTEGGTIQINLEESPPAGHAEDVAGGAVIVMVQRGRPVSIDLMNAGDARAEGHLRLAARSYGLDADALVAAAQAALAAPDRVVKIEVGAPSAA